MSEQRTDLGTWLAAKSVKQSKLAKALGVSAPTVSEWIAGSRRPSLANAIKIELYTSGAVTVESFGLDVGEVADAAKLVARRRAAAKRRPKAADAA